MPNNKNIIFGDKTIEDLSRDIYENSKNKKLQLDLLIQEIHGFIQTADDILQLAPIIKEFYDVSIKNDEHLVKLAGVVQRIMAKSSGGDEESFLLSDAEKEDLISALQEDVNDLQIEADKIDAIKEKSKNVGGD